MPKITAIIHTHNHAQSIGRTLDSLLPCDEVVVIDHGSEDRTVEIARDQGAIVKNGIPGVDRGTYAVEASNDWVLCLLPQEALSEALEASLFEWKAQQPDSAVIGYACALRQEQEDGWKSLPPQMRLVNRTRLNWSDALPPTMHNVPQLAGSLMRFRE